MSKQTATKRKKKKSTTPKATSSFASLVSDAQLNALKPFIEQQVQMAAYQTIQSLSRPLLENVQVIQQSQMAILRILKTKDLITDETFRDTVMDVEDEALGRVKTDDPSKAGDTIRLTLQSKTSVQEEFSELSNVQINAVNTKGPSGTLQTGVEELEAGLVGKTAGELVEITVPGKVPEGSEETPIDILFKIEVLRVSTKPAEVESE